MKASSTDECNYQADLLLCISFCFPSIYLSLSLVCFISQLRGNWSLLNIKLSLIGMQFVSEKKIPSRSREITKVFCVRIFFSRVNIFICGKLSYAKDLHHSIEIWASMQWNSRMKREFLLCWFREIILKQLRNERRKKIQFKFDSIAN